MTAVPNDLTNNLTIRPVTGREELDLFRRFPYVLNEELAGDLEAGRRRPEWMWVALRGDRLVARAGWWGRDGDTEPFLLNVFDVDDTDPERVAIGVRLLEAAAAEVVPRGARMPEYDRMLPPDWREDAAVRRAVEDRVTALERTGARLLVERLRLEWRPGTPLPAPSGRLRFRPVRDREELVGLMARALEGTLDAHSIDDLARTATAEEAATAHYEDEIRGYERWRDQWRVATLPDGTPVGFVAPGRNSYNATIGYLAVLPEHRGNGYVDDILAEGTRTVAAQDVPRIRASTDVGNAPMAAAFRRAGYVVFERMINMVWDRPPEASGTIPVSS
ncbi:GNAT family N-acetyltransferase [Streptomyces sp. HB2AG]|uniref:GNAT family N-acetyltransferase n=1 Tax=Streptomyces sp. HB2AG TaxID=2983400 RepID=UPI0022AB2B70|nr:GNAT family N-acetyltransferase [Streptomyces sp. HB2AG]MCZ2527591.1 GNAT family N-acetyltransferase [Streptomyces sp. HB2AG]